MRSTRTALLLAAILAVPLAACGGGDDKNSSTPAAGSETGVCATTKATGDLLAQVCDKGTLTVSTDAGVPAAVVARPRDG